MFIYRLFEKRILDIPSNYMDDVIRIGKKVFSPLYQFENGLRLAINKYLTILYGEEWWEKSLKYNLPKVYEYAEDIIKRRNYMPSIAESKRVDVLPIHYITLGHLEEIVKRYRSDCIPALFPNLEFFLGHMCVIKEVRNLYSHMFPCITMEDVKTAKREITTLAKHINYKL